MAPDQIFRIVLAAALLAFMPAAFAFRVKSRTDEKLDRFQEGLFILVTLRLAGLSFWAGMITFLVRPSAMEWSSLPLPAGARWGGAAVFLAGGVLLVWTLRHLGPNLTDTVVTRRNHALVTDGPYAWVRNPFYDSAALLVLACSLLTANWFLLLTGALVVVLLAVRTRIEEEKLIARFGDAYRAYMRQTGRFLPRARTTRGDQE